jgi:hypothetical protein
VRRFGGWAGVYAGGGRDTGNSSGRWVGRRKGKRKKEEGIFQEYALLQFPIACLFCAMHF